MADNGYVDPSTTPPATDDIGGVYYQRVKLVDGTLDSDAAIPGGTGGLHVQPGKGSLTDGSTTITSASTSQQIFAANTTRRYLLVQNISDTKMYLNFGSAATAGAGSILLPPNGGSIVMDSGFVTTETVNIICATSGKAFTAKQA